MKQNYDFSNAERGKFYRKGARLRLPIYLEYRLQNRLQRLADTQGRELGEVVNALLAKDVVSTKPKRTASR